MLSSWECLVYLSDSSRLSGNSPAGLYRYLLEFPFIAWFCIWHQSTWWHSLNRTNSWIWVADSIIYSDVMLLPCSQFCLVRLSFITEFKSPVSREAAFLKCSNKGSFSCELHFPGIPCNICTQNWVLMLYFCSKQQHNMKSSQFLPLMFSKFTSINWLFEMIQQQCIESCLLLSGLVVSSQKTGASHQRFYHESYEQVVLLIVNTLIMTAHCSVDQLHWIWCITIGYLTFR